MFHSDFTSRARLARDLQEFYRGATNAIDRRL
jgi:hypothetical protein